MDEQTEINFEYGKRILELESRVDKIEEKLEEVIQNVAVVLMALVEASAIGVVIKEEGE